MLPSEPAFHGHCHHLIVTVRPGSRLCKEIAVHFDYSPIYDREVAKSDALPGLPFVHCDRRKILCAFSRSPFFRLVADTMPMKSSFPLGNIAQSQILPPLGNPGYPIHPRLDRDGNIPLINPKTHS